MPDVPRARETTPRSTSSRSSFGRWRAPAASSSKRAAVELLLEVCGSDLSRIATELDKLAIWLGPDAAGGTPVDAATLRGLVAGTGLLSGWELADALTERGCGQRHRRRAAPARCGRRADSHPRRPRVTRPLSLRAKAMTEAGAPPKAVVDAARAWYFREVLSED